MEPGVKVLVAEDNADNRQLVEDILAGQGYSVTFARDGNEAVSLARQLIPDLVILDINMPGKNGFEVCADLKADSATVQIPILMLTALSDVENRVRGLGLGADDYLVKPFNPRELVARIDTRLRAKIETDHLRADQDLIRRTFERFVPAQVVEQLLRQPENVRLGGQLQEVTVLFADLEGFTAVSEHTDPERLLELLNQYHALLAEHIQREGGLIDKFLGDGLMALFNTPLPQEDHPLHAVRAAVNIQRALADFHAKLEPPFRLPVNFGVSTGIAVVGNVGTADLMDFTAIGDTVNLASRLQGLCEHGQILISDAVYAQVAPAISGELFGTRIVKGREEPVVIYTVLGLRP